jgi:hypothetical protein
VSSSKPKSAKHPGQSSGVGNFMPLMTKRTMLKLWAAWVFAIKRIVLYTFLAIAAIVAALLGVIFGLKAVRKRRADSALDIDSAIRKAMIRRGKKSN